jgi:hypothetical protein
MALFLKKTRNWVREKSSLKLFNVNALGINSGGDKKSSSAGRIEEMEIQNNGKDMVPMTTITRR